MTEEPPETPAERLFAQALEQLSPGETPDLEALLESHPVYAAELASLHEHPQVVANALLREDEHPVAGRMRSPEPVGSYEKTPIAVRRLAPALGEHSDELLAELGVGPDEIASLRADGIVE